MSPGGANQPVAATQSLALPSRATWDNLRRIFPQREKEALGTASEKPLFVHEHGKISMVKNASEQWCVE